jgi:hypothetical protein
VNRQCVPSQSLQTVLARTAKVEIALAQSEGQVSGLSGAAAELGIYFGIEDSIPQDKQIPV